MAATDTDVSQYYTTPTPNSYVPYKPVNTDAYASGFTEANPGPKATGQGYWDGDTQYDAYGNFVSKINTPTQAQQQFATSPTVNQVQTNGLPPGYLPWGQPVSNAPAFMAPNPTVGSATSSMFQSPATGPTPTNPAATAPPPAPAPTPAPTGGGGIVNSATFTGAAPMPTPPTVSGVSIGPQLQQVQANQTVQGQLADILKTGNPLLEGAKTRAAQAANARGLQNSSMAVQSGEEAIVNTAMPIAQQDAAVYQKQALVNQDISNQFLSMDKGAAYDLEKAYAAFQQNNYLFDKDASLKKYISDTGNSTQEKVAAMQVAASTANTAATIAGNLQAAGMSIEAGKLMQQAGFTHTDSTNLRLYQQQNLQTYLAGVNNIQAANIDPDAKSAEMHSWNTLHIGIPTGIYINPDAPFPKPNTVVDAPAPSPVGNSGGGTDNSSNGGG